MDIKAVVELFKKFKSLEEKKRSLDVNGLKDYLNTKKQIHQLGYSLDDVRKLNTEDEMINYINSKNQEQVSVNETEVKTKEVTAQEPTKQTEPINPIKVEVETKSVEVNSESNVIENTTEQNKEEFISIIEESDTIESENHIDNNSQGQTNEVVEETKDNEDTNEEEQDELKTLLEENVEEIVEEVKKIKKKVNENIVEITTGKNLSVVVGTNKIKISIPKSATVNIQHSLLLELYNQTFGLKEEEIEEIEKEAEVNELEIESVEETVSEQPVIEEKVREQTTEEPKNVETTKKRSRRSKGCNVRIPRNKIFIKPFTTEDSYVNELRSQIGQFNENEIEKAIANILDLKYDEEKEGICKPEEYSLENITPETLYKLRIVGLKFKAIKHLFSKLLNVSEDEAQEKLHQILVNESDDKIVIFFGKKKLNEIRGQ